jgi:hypothetical protein
VSKKSQFAPMGKLTQDGFLSEMTKMMQKAKADKGSFRVMFKHGTLQIAAWVLIGVAVQWHTFRLCVCSDCLDLNS